MRFTVVIGVLLFTGCYAYAPGASPTPESGSRVRIELTRDGANRGFGELGEYVDRVDGDVLTLRGDTLVLAVTTVYSRRRGELFWPRDQLVVPPDAIERLEQRRFSFWRSAVFVGGVIGVPALLNGLFGGPSGGDPDGSGDDQGPPSTT